MFFQFRHDTELTSVTAQNIRYSEGFLGPDPCCPRRAPIRSASRNHVCASIDIDEAFPTKAFLHHSKAPDRTEVKNKIVRSTIWCSVC